MSAAQAILEHRYRIAANAMGSEIARDQQMDFDQAVDQFTDEIAEQAVRFGVLTRPRGVRYPFPPHYFLKSPYQKSMSHVTGVRGRHLGWRYPKDPYIPPRYPASLDYRSAPVRVSLSQGVQQGNAEIFGARPGVRFRDDYEYDDDWY